MWENNEMLCMNTNVCERSGLVLQKKAFTITYSKSHKISKKDSKLEKTPTFPPLELGGKHVGCYAKRSYPLFGTNKCRNCD